MYQHVDEDDQDNKSEDQRGESDSDEEHILKEIGLSGSDDDYDNVEGGDILEGPQTSHIYTKSGRRATRFKL